MERPVDALKPEAKDDTNAFEKRKPILLSRLLKRMVSLTVTLVILGGLGYIGWLAFQQKPGGNRAGNGRPTFRYRCWLRPPACRTYRSISTASAPFAR
jgi:hypothetical protein